MNHASSKTRYAIQCVLAALIAFAGSAVLLKGIAIPLWAPGGTPEPGLLSRAIAALLILTGAILVVMAATELAHTRGSPGGSSDPAKQRRG
jgi:hypothetical protein